MTYDPKHDDKSRLGALVLVLLLVSAIGKVASCLPKETPMPRTQLVALVCLALSLAGCSAFTKQDAKTVVTLANGACLLLQNDPALAAECATLEEITPIVTELLAAKRAAAAKAAASASAAPVGSAK